MKHAILPATIAALALLQTACDSGGIERQPNTAVAFVHAAPSLPQIAFLREEREEATVAFGGGAAFSFEADQYDFNVDVFDIATGLPDRRLSFSATLLAETDHVFVLVEGSAGLEALVVSAPRFDAASSSAEAAAVHAALSHGPLDVFLAAPGTDLTTAAPFANLGYTSGSPPATISPGDYKLSVTAAGAPAGLLFEDTITLAAGESYTFVVTDGESPSLAALNVVGVTDTPARLADENAQSGLRVINAIADRLDRDIVIDDEFATPLFAALPFATAPAFGIVAPGARVMTVTPAGNPSVEELEEDLSLAAGREYTSIIVGDGATFDAATQVEDRRPISGQSKLRLYNAAAAFELVEFYILVPGTDVASALPAYASTAPAMSQTFAVPPDSYEVTLRDSTTETIIAGPTAISVAGGGVYGLVAVDAPGGTTAEIVLIDDF